MKINLCLKHSWCLRPANQVLERLRQVDSKFRTGLVSTIRQYTKREGSGISLVYKSLMHLSTKTKQKWTSICDLEFYMFCCCTCHTPRSSLSRITEVTLVQRQGVEDGKSYLSRQSPGRRNIIQTHLCIITLPFLRRIANLRVLSPVQGDQYFCMYSLSGHDNDNKNYYQ